MTFNFPAHGFDFYLEFFVFADFVAEEAGSDAGFALQAGRCQDIGVARFVGALFEVAGFDPAFGDQGLKAVVDFTETDAEDARQGPLRCVGIDGQIFEKFVGYGVIEFGIRHRFGLLF